MSEENVELDDVDEETGEEEFGGLETAMGDDGKGKAADAIGDKEGPSLSESLLGRVFSQSHVSSALAALSAPGKDARHLSMRANLRDWNHVHAAARHYAKCMHFEDRESAEELLMSLALGTSIEGLSRRQIVAAVIGYHEPGLGGVDEKGLAGRLRKWLRLGGDKNNED
jgi:hypothetical protein